MTKKTVQQNDIKKLLVYGGSFDPPHMGHMNLLQSAIATVKPNKTLVVPSGVAPHKISSQTPGEVRLEMCRCFLTLGGNIYLSDIELRRSGKSYTIDTIGELEIIFPNAQIYLCVGSDMFLNFESWQRWETLLNKAVLVIGARQEDIAPDMQKTAERLQHKGGRLMFVHGKALPMASADIRKAVKKGKDVSEYVPKEALSVIKEHGLYLS